MAAFAPIIFAEKAMPWPTPVRYTTAVVLMLYGYGVLMLASPQLTFQKDGSAAMPATMQMKTPASGNMPAVK
jgi:hypothetical protein